MPSSLNGTGVTFNDTTTLQSGNIPAANLGTGTANSTTFLRGDKTWAAPTSAAVVDTFNSSGTWTKPASGSMARIQVWGGGGGAGRGNLLIRQSGGGGGGYNEITVALSSLAASVTVTVGAAGTGRTGSTGNGTAGGTSSFGALLSAFGGGGGVGHTGNSGTTTSGFGGGQLSAGAVGQATFNSSTALVGAPRFYTPPDNQSASIWHGGTQVVDGGYNIGKVEGDALFGGGAGEIGIGYVAGVSVYGGNGGARNNAGVQPGGGGGASSSVNGNGSNGGAGRVIVTVW
jgi:hypothetical protein